MDEKLKFLYPEIKKSGKIFLIAGIVMGIIGLFLLYVSVYEVPGSNPGIGNLVVFYLMTLLFLFVGIALIRSGFNRLKPEKSPLIRLIKERPSEIVWIYHHRVLGRYQKSSDPNAGTFFLDIRTDKRKHFSAAIKKDHLMEVFDLLQTTLPKVTFGYSQELMQKYYRDPNLLRK